MSTELPTERNHTMTGLLTSLRSLILALYVRICRRGDRTFATWQPCSFDCYEEGGCPNCGSYVEWEDPDYGTCGRWVPFEDLDRADEAQVDILEYMGWRHVEVEEFTRDEIETLADHDIYLPVEQMTDRERDWYEGQAWKPVDQDGSPNPIIGTRPLFDGGTARLYRNGVVDAIDGSVYSLSPGFKSLGELEIWIKEVSSESVASDTTVTNNFSQADGTPEASDSGYAAHSETGEGTLPPLHAQITLPSNEYEHNLYLSGDLERIRFIDICQAVGLEFPNNKKGA